MRAQRPTTATIVRAVVACVAIAAVPSLLAQGPVVAPPRKAERAPSERPERRAPATVAPPAVPPERAAKPAAIVPIVNAGFESDRSTTDTIDGWQVIQHAGRTSYAMSLDDTEKRSGDRSLKIVNIGREPYGSVYQILPAAGQQGKTLRLSGWIRTVDARGNGFGSGAGLLLHAMRQGYPIDGAFMQRNAVSGTTHWTRYEIAMKVPPEAEQIEIGINLFGPGSAWLDDVELAVLASD